MIKLLLVIFITSSSARAEITAAFYPESAKYYVKYTGEVTEIILFQPVYVKNFSVIKIGTFELDSGLSPTISIDPFKAKLREAVAEVGGNAYVMDPSVIVNKQTKQYMGVSASAYLAQWKGQPIQFDGPETISLRLYADSFALRDRRTEAEDRLRTSPYAALRNRENEGILREWVLSQFSIDQSSDIAEWREIPISALNDVQRQHLETFLGRMLAAATLGELVDKYPVEFSKPTQTKRIQKLRELSSRYPKDYAEFKADWKLVNGSINNLEEDAVSGKKPGPAAPKAQSKP